MGASFMNFMFFWRPVNCISIVLLNIIFLFFWRNKVMMMMMMCTQAHANKCLGTACTVGMTAVHNLNYFWLWLVSRMDICYFTLKLIGAADKISVRNVCSKIDLWEFVRLLCIDVTSLNINISVSQFVNSDRVLTQLYDRCTAASHISQCWSSWVHYEGLYCRWMFSMTVVLLCSLSLKLVLQRSVWLIASLDV